MSLRQVIADYLLASEPTSRQVATVLESLEMVLRSAMRRRGVWTRSPTEWGYAGKSWKDRETFYDLLLDCFTEVYGPEKREHLRNYLREGVPIERVIPRMVKNFLEKQERTKSPQNHNRFKNIQWAVERAGEEGRISSVATDQKRASNRTLVAPPQTRHASPITLRRLREVVTGWSDFRTLAAQLGRCSKPARTAANHILERLLGELSDPWRLGDLVEILAEVEPAGVEPTVLDLVPSGLVGVAGWMEDEQELERTIDQMQQEVRNSRLQSKVKQRLLHLLNWLWERYREMGEFPTQGEAAQHLGIPKQRVSDDFARLQEICRKIVEQKPD